jgi:hypothetical protein
MNRCMTLLLVYILNSAVTDINNIFDDRIA